MTIHTLVQILEMITPLIFLFLTVENFRRWKKTEEKTVPTYIVAAAALTFLSSWLYISSYILQLPLRTQFVNAAITLVLIIIAIIFRWRR